MAATTLDLAEVQRLENEHQPSRYAKRDISLVRGDGAYLFDSEGRRGVPGEGFSIKDWNGDSNRSCLCRIVNEEPWVNGQSWKDWLFTQKLDRFATKLQSEGLDQMPIIFRPFH